jgi:predicted transcriptional regulator
VVRVHKKNRGRIDILADILSLSTEAVRKTHIMYGANLSYEQVSNYVEELQDKGFLEEVTTKRYRITDKGRLYLEEYEALKRMMEFTGFLPADRRYELA